MPMRLSEAIRLGATMKPQGFGSLLVVGSNGREYTCAMGAAFDAVGAAQDIRAVAFVFPGYSRKVFPICDACKLPARVGVTSMVMHLNDAHSWTREKIADWVEEQEVSMGLIGKPEEKKEEVPQLAAAGRR